MHEVITMTKSISTNKEVDQGDFVMMLVEIIINSNRGYVITH